MKVLVTGGCGFLGGYVVHDLIQAGHEVVIVDVRDFPGNLEIAGDGKLPSAPVEVADVRDLEAMCQLIDRHQVDAIAHLAYLLLTPVRADPRRAVDVNCMGTATVFDAARLKGIEKLVWTSSGGLMNGYVGTDVVVDDDTPPRPSDLYSFTKLLNEAVAQQYYETFGLRSVALRPVYINGLGLPSSSMGSAMLKEAVINPVFGRPGVVPYAHDVIPFVDIEELAIAVRVALESNLAPGAHVYNLRPSPAPMLDVMAHIEALIPGVSLTPGEGSFWGTGRPFTSAYGQKMEDELGYQASRPANKQFERMIERVKRIRPTIAKYYDV